MVATADKKPETRPLRLRGAVCEVMRLLQTEEGLKELVNPYELLVHGAAGTGKSMGILGILDRMCWKHPGLSVLVVRKTRKDCTDSVMKTLEDRVFSRYAGVHPAKAARQGRRDTRSDYEYPNGKDGKPGSRMVFRGMDDAERIKSTEWDVIYVNEATEITLEDWEMLVSRARGDMEDPAIQVRGIIADCNPASENHWLWQRCQAKHAFEADRTQTLALQSKHSDNPAMDPAYLRGLQTLTGVRYRRMFLGEWVSPEGMVFPSFDAKVHAPDKLHFCSDPFHPNRHDFEWTLAAKDWGFAAPGVLQVYGIHDGGMYLVHEVYRTKQTIDWWADVAADAYDQWGFARGVADPAEPGSLEMLNARLVSRGCPGVWEKANNDRFAGFNAVRQQLGNERGLEPRLYFFRGAHAIGKDKDLLEAKRCASTIDEMGEFVYLPHDPDKRDKDEPDPKCADHGVDTCRYAVMNFLNSSAPDKVQHFEAGTLGAELGHDGVLI